MTLLLSLLSLSLAPLMVDFLLSRYTKKGTPFYVNKLTGANSWEKPQILLRHSSLEDVSQVIGTSSWHVSAPRYSTKTGIVRVCVLLHVEYVYILYLLYLCVLAC